MLQSRLTRLGEVLEHIAVLLAQRIADGEHALDKATTIRAVGAEAGVAPQDPMAQGSLGVVVGGARRLAYRLCESDLRQYQSRAQRFRLVAGRDLYEKAGG